jgi:adenylate kinase
MGSRYVFLGSPGAGKGTQSAIGSQVLGVPTIGTGQIFRQAIADETPMGKQISQFVHTGLLVPDDLTTAIVLKRLREKDCQKGFILDGYPRSIVQAKSFDVFLQKMKTALDRVLYFKIEASFVIERMSKRRICHECGHSYNLVSQPPKQEGKCDDCGAPLTTRSDDSPEAVRKRMQVYEETTMPLLQYYEKKGILSVVDAAQHVQQVTKQVHAIFAEK